MEPATQILRSFESLKDVPDAQLDWLIQNSELVNVTDESYISTPGDPIGGPYFVLEGRISLYMKQGSENREIRMLIPGDIFGYLPYSRGMISSFWSKAVGGATIYAFNTTAIRTMMRDHFELTQALVHIMNNRVKDFTALQQQQDKMAALGKMSAGLAHELNNPAAALVRDSIALRNHLKLEPQALKALTELQLTAAQIDLLNQELFKITQLKASPLLSLRERSKQENLIANWLDKKGIDHSDELAEMFVELHVSIENLELISNGIPATSLETIFTWVKNVLEKERIIDDIQVSAERIGELIQSIKIYTHMDRGADKIMTNIHDGIRNTLSIFGHKIRKYNVTLNEHYDDTLPKVLAYPGELNQVWTNLVDNALDAMEAKSDGQLTITTERDREFVKITISDNGTGIPDVIKQNIFDPFFTTKEVGKGTGMGLETVQRIIQRHKGTVKVASVPGNTTFTICFPMNGQTEHNQPQD